MQGTSLMTHKPTEKEKYWARRKAGIRGQGDKPKPTVIPKGQTITLPDKTVRGKLITGRTLPNAEGSHMVYTKSGMKVVNRRQARVRQKSRLFTRKGLRNHERNTLKNPPFELPYPPHQTNHDRMLIRAEERERVEVG